MSPFRASKAQQTSLFSERIENISAINKKVLWLNWQ